MKITEKQIRQIAEEELNDTLEEASITDETLEEAFVIDDEGGPMKTESSADESLIEEEILEMFGFGKKKNVNCQSLYKRYQEVMYSSASPAMADQVRRLAEKIKKNCPEYANKVMAETNEKE